MADQYSGNVREMFTFHMQIRSAANTSANMHLNLLIKYAVNILRSFCEYSVTILIKSKNSCSKYVGTIIANSLRTSRHYAANMISENLVSAVGNTVEPRWLELVGTVGVSSTHPCVRAIPSLTIFKLVHVYFMSSRTSRFLSTKVVKRT